LHKMPLRRILLHRRDRISQLYQRSALMPQQLPQNREARSRLTMVVLAWLPVTLPLLWGIWQTVKKAAVLFR
jgi:hypothetical protein